jgi:hypothetical protein
MPLGHCQSNTTRIVATAGLDPGYSMAVVGTHSNGILTNVMDLVEKVDDA